MSEETSMREHLWLLFVRKERIVEHSWLWKREEADSPPRSRTPQELIRAMGSPGKHESEELLSGFFSVKEESGEQSNPWVRFLVTECALPCQAARYNLSGHADAEQIAHVVARVCPARVMLVHSASETLEALARCFPKITVDIPASGDIVHLRASPHKGTGHTRVTTTQAAGEPPLLSQGQGQAEGEPERVPPTIHALWQVARERGPQHPWTAVELGQHFYGPKYTPDKRATIEQVLREASVFHH